MTARVVGVGAGLGGVIAVCGLYQMFEAAGQSLRSVILPLQSTRDGVANPDLSMRDWCWDQQVGKSKVDVETCGGYRYVTDSGTLYKRAMHVAEELSENGY